MSVSSSNFSISSIFVLIQKILHTFRLSINNLAYKNYPRCFTTNMPGDTKTILESYKNLEKDKEEKIKKVVEEYSSESEMDEEKNSQYETELNLKKQKIETNTKGISKGECSNRFIDYSFKKPKIKHGFIQEIKNIDSDVYGIGISYTNKNIIHIYTKNVESKLFTKYEDEIKQNLIGIEIAERKDEEKLCYEISVDSKTFNIAKDNREKQEDLKKYGTIIRNPRIMNDDIII